MGDIPVLISELPIPEHLKHKLENPKLMRVSLDAEWANAPPKVAPVEPPKLRVAQLSQQLQQLPQLPVVQQPHVPTVIKDAVNTVVAPQIANIIKEVVSEVIPGQRTQRKDAVKPVANMKDVEVPTDYDVQEIDYDDYAQG